MRTILKGNKYLAALLVSPVLVLLLLSLTHGQEQGQIQQGQLPSTVPQPGQPNQAVPQGFQLPTPPANPQLPAGLTRDNLTALFPVPPSPPPMPTPPASGVTGNAQNSSIPTQDNHSKGLKTSPIATPSQTPPSTAPPFPVAPPAAKTQPSKQSAPMVQQSGPNNVSLAFDDADIFEIAHTVFGEILKVNYLIDSRVKGRITFKTVKPVSNGDVLPIMSTIFRLNGVSIMEESGLYRIIPLADISKEPVGVKFGKDAKSLSVKGFSMIQIVPLNFMNSKDMVEILTPFLSSGATIKEVPGKNCLIISDTDENIQRLLQIINIFDDDAFKDVKVELFVFKNLSIKDVIDDMKNTFPLFTATTQDSLKMKYLPIEKLNAILVVAPDEQFLKHFKKWVDIIDNVFEGAKPRIYVYPLQNSQAEHIMSILSQIFTDSGASKSSQDKSLTPTSTPTPTPTSKSTLTSTLTSPTSTTSSSKSDTTKDSKKTSSVGAINVSNSLLVSSETKIYYDDKLNSLVILALPKDYLYIEELIKKLDAVPRQVLIEALIIEVALNDDLKYGLQWFINNNITIKNHHYTGASMLEEGKNIGLSSSLFSTTSGLSYAVFNGAGVLTALIQSLSNATEISVLSNPTILVSDNSEAKIQVGDKVPIVTSATNVTGTTNIQNQYQYQDTGVILKVKPQINDSGLVKLDVTQEVSDVEPTVTTPGVDSPTINVRSVNTNLVVQDGASIAIGGLIQDKTSKTQNGIPFLSKIPIIGGLFGFQQKTHTRTELMIIITPHVVKNIADAARMTGDFKEKLMGLKKMLSKDKSDLIPGATPSKSDSPSTGEPDKK